MNYQTILLALVTFATQAASASIIPRNDLLPKPLALSIFAKCTSDDCDGDSSAIFFTTTNDAGLMVATNMEDYWKNGKGDGLGPEYQSSLGFSGKRKIGEIIFKSTTGAGDEDLGQEFWVDDPSKDGLHLSVSHTNNGTVQHVQRADTWI
jgi:hypothetical protein